MRSLVVIIMLLAVNAATTQAPAQVPDQPTSRAQSESLPTPKQAMTLYSRVDGVVRSLGAVESTPSTPVPAAMVTLRFADRVLGRGLDASGGPECIDRAARLAVERLWSRLGVDAGGVAGVGLSPEVRAMVDRVRISVELAGPAIPFELADLLDSDVAPGLRGIGVRTGGGRLRVMFPSRIAQTGRHPGDVVRVLVHEDVDDVLVGTLPLDLLVKRWQVTLYRFETVEIAQISDMGAPRFLFRGGRVVPMGDVTTVSIRDMADGIAAHLVARVRGSGDDDEGLHLVDRYNAALDLSSDASIDPVAQASAVLALAAYGSVRSADEQGAAAARELADKLSASLVAGLDDYDPGVRVTTAALLAAAAWRSGARELDASTIKALELDEFLGPTERALVAYGNACAARVTGDQAHAEVARRMLGNVYQELGQRGLVAAMPWAVWAERELADFGVADGDLGERTIRAAAALRAFREIAWEFQVASSDVPGQEDLAGGFVFGKGRGMNQWPTWQSLRPLAGLASMVGDEELTRVEELPGELSRVLAGVRFVRQLAADDWVLHACESPGRARWGIRAATWEYAMPLQASSLGLLVLVETELALEAAGERMGRGE